MATTSENIEYFKNIQDRNNLVDGVGVAFVIESALSEIGDAVNLTQYPGLPSRLPSKVESLLVRYQELMSQLEE